MKSLNKLLALEVLRFLVFKFNMSINKYKIVRNFSSKISISSNDGNKLLATFLEIIKTQSSLGLVKISGFGSFKTKTSAKRMGRNPKTLEPYIIASRNKLVFKPSNKIREIIN